MADKNNFDQAAYDFGARVFNNSFNRGNISLAPEDLGKKMNRSDYREYLHDNLLQLSMDVCKQSLQDWGETWLRGYHSQHLQLSWAARHISMMKALIYWESAMQHKPANSPRVHDVQQRPHQGPLPGHLAL